MGFIKEFKEFAIKGNMVDMAVGIIMGGAFGGVVNSLVKDVMMPVIGLFTGGVDFSKHKTTLKAAADGKDAVDMSWGMFVTVFINFLILAFAVFLLVKAINTAKAKANPPAPPPPPPGPSNQEKLLSSILDELRKR